MKNIKMHWRQINKEIGNIDIYLLDVLLKGYIDDEAKILDVGCGEGRNIHYFLKNQYDVFGVDKDPQAIQFVRMLAKQFGHEDLEGRFQRMSMDQLKFPDNCFDLTISSAVLHFVKSEEEYERAIQELHRVTKKGGLIFIRSMSGQIDPNKEEELPIYFLLSEELREKLISPSRFTCLEPYKYVTVAEKRVMNVMVLQKI